MVRRLCDRYAHWLNPDDPGHAEHDSGRASGRRRYPGRAGQEAA
jgi:hypothetical protein